MAISLSTVSLLVLIIGPVQVLSQLPPGFPPQAFSNASNILQELLSQAVQQQAPLPSGSAAGAGGINNPFIEFFRSIVMFFMNMVNNFIRLMTGGVGGFGPSKSSDDLASNLVRRDVPPVDDDDLKALHAKAHGPSCLCSGFSRANIPGLDVKDVKEKPSKLFKRSVNEPILTADQVVDFLDQRAVEKLLETFQRSEKGAL